LAGRDAAFGAQARMMAFRSDGEPRAMVGGFWLEVGVETGAVATGSEQREPQRVLAGQKGTTGEPPRSRTTQ
jgi:hypothetical protein